VLIIALGDSLTAGFPLEPFSWILSLGELPAEVINTGINGDTLSGMATRLDREVLAHKPDVCFFMGGSNDAFLGRDLEEMQNNAAQIQKRILDRGILSVAGLPPPTLFPDLEAKLDPFRDWIRENLENPLDFRRAFGYNDEINPEFLPDGVHPSREAYENMGHVALKFFRTLPLSFD